MSMAMLRAFAPVPLLLMALSSPAHSWDFHAGSGDGLNALIARAAPGDTITIHGTVQEGTVHVNKPLTLLGGDHGVIDGLGAGEVLLVEADDVTVRGLTFRNPQHSNLDDLAGIKVKSSIGVVIEGNTLERCFFAIFLSSVRDARVEGNTVIGDPADMDRMANGIHLWKCTNITILHNTVQHHRDGIYLEFVTDSHIAHNTTMHNDRYGLHFMFSHRDTYEDNHFEDNGAGVAVMFSKQIDMRRNAFLANRGASAYGLLLKEINDATIAENRFADNTTGIMVDGCNRVRVADNIFRMNGWALRMFSNAFDCVFTGNTFSGNTFDLSTNGNLRNNTLEGNYWDRYTGYDLDRDGHGDVPHRPLGFFTLLVERMPYAMAFSRSLFVSLLDRAERLIPSLGPEAMKDERPLMRPPSGKKSEVVTDVAPARPGLPAAATACTHPGHVSAEGRRAEGPATYQPMAMPWPMVGGRVSGLKASPPVGGPGTFRTHVGPCERTPAVSGLQPCSNARHFQPMAKAATGHTLRHSVATPALAASLRITRRTCESKS